MNVHHIVVNLELQEFECNYVLVKSKIRAANLMHVASLGIPCMYIAATRMLGSRKYAS